MRTTNQTVQRRLTMICGVGATVFSIAACAGKDAPAAGAAAASSTTAAPSPGTATTGASVAQVAADAHALATYPLTEDHVTKVAQVMRAIQSLEKSDPALKAEWENHSQSSGPQTIDDAVARVNSAPRAPEILKSAGISAHDYVYTTFALMYASVAYQMKKAGQPINSEKLTSQLNPANVDFVATHQKEIQELGAINAAHNASGNN